MCIIIRLRRAPVCPQATLATRQIFGLALGVPFWRLVSARGTRVPLKQTIHTDNLKVFPSVKVVSGLVSSVAHPWWHNRDSILTVFRITVHPGQVREISSTASAEHTARWFIYQVPAETTTWETTYALKCYVTQNHENWEKLFLNLYLPVVVRFFCLDQKIQFNYLLIAKNY